MDILSFLGLSQIRINPDCQYVYSAVSRYQKQDDFALSCQNPLQSCILGLVPAQLYSRVGEWDFIRGFEQPHRSIPISDSRLDVHYVF